MRSVLPGGAILALLHHVGRHVRPPRRPGGQRGGWTLGQRRLGRSKGQRRLRRPIWRKFYQCVPHVPPDLRGGGSQRPAKDIRQFEVRQVVWDLLELHGALGVQPGRGRGLRHLVVAPFGGLEYPVATQRHGRSRAERVQVLRPTALVRGKLVDSPVAVARPASFSPDARRHVRPACGRARRVAGRRWRRWA